MKKTICLFLALLLCLPMYACGGDEKMSLPGSETASSSSKPITTNHPAGTERPTEPSTTPTTEPTTPQSTKPTAPSETEPTTPHTTEATEPRHDVLTIISWPESISRNETGTVKVQGKPNTEYTISVYYKSGESQAEGLEAKTSDNDGYVSWSWKIGGRTSAGTFKIVVSGGGESKTVYFSIKG